MKDFELKVGDLIRLRDDLVEGNEYCNEYFVIDMNFKGFRKIKELSHNGKCVIIYGSDFPYHYTKEMIAEAKRLTKYETIYKREEREEPILDKKERKYLRAIIRPFRKDILFITREYNIPGLYECITIDLKGDITDLPRFAVSKMYKGMELDKQYILEELGL